MSSDRTVGADRILRSVMDLQRRGPDAVINELDAVEPALVDYLLESCCEVHHRLMRRGLSGRESVRIHRQCQTIVLVCVTALRGAHFDLWRKDHEPVDPPRVAEDRNGDLASS